MKSTLVLILINFNILYPCLCAFWHYHPFTFMKVFYTCKLYSREKGLTMDCPPIVPSDKLEEVVRLFYTHY